MRPAMRHVERGLPCGGVSFAVWNGASGSCCGLGRADGGRKPRIKGVRPLYLFMLSLYAPFYVPLCPLRLRLRPYDSVERLRLSSWSRSAAQLAIRWAEQPFQTMN